MPCDMRSRSGVVVGLAAAAGVFGAAAMMSAATAPAARADDYTDIVNAVNGDLADGQAAFTLAFADFGASDPSNGLAELFDGLDDDSLNVSANLFQGTVDALTNNPIDSSQPVTIGPETDFAGALTDAHQFVTEGESYFSTAATFLASGDYASAAFDTSVGTSLVFALPWEALIMGAAGSLGF
jgi:hypothetical protein